MDRSIILSNKINQVFKKYQQIQNNLKKKII